MQCLLQYRFHTKENKNDIKNYTIQDQGCYFWKDRGARTPRFLECGGQISNSPPIIRCLMKLSSWSKILALVLQFILSVDITRSFYEMKYGQILWSQKLRKYYKKYSNLFKFVYGLHCWICCSNIIIGQNVFIFAFGF